MAFESNVLHTSHSHEKPKLQDALSNLLDQGIQLPLVSVVVTAYNSEQFIHKTLYSVLEQNYPHFECIIVEDCATDQTLSIIETFIEETHDSRFSLVRHDVNGGQLASQITGFLKSKGKFIIFLDADDLLLPDAIQTHLFFHLTISPVVAMTCLDSAMIDQDGVLLSGHHREVRPLFWPWLRPSPIQKHTDIYGESVNFWLVPPSSNNAVVMDDGYYWTTQSFMMFRRDILDLILPCQTVFFKICADYYLVRMVHAFNSTVFIQKTGGSYRIHQFNNYAHNALTSADQQSGDYLKFNWQPVELKRLACETIFNKYDQFTSIFGEFHTTRALIQLNTQQLLTFRLMKNRVGYFMTLRYWIIFYIGIILNGTRKKCVRALRILWAGY